MSVKIETIDADKIEVNAKLVYRDANENWVTTQELTTQKASAFNDHLRAIKRASQD